MNKENLSILIKQAQALLAQPSKEDCELTTLFKAGLKNEKFVITLIELVTGQDLSKLSYLILGFLLGARYKEASTLASILKDSEVKE